MGVTVGDLAADNDPMATTLTPVERRLFSHDSLTIGATGVCLGAVIALTVYLRFGEHYFFLSDGALYRVVARWPFADGHVLRPVAPVYGDSYRYGRILYPLLAWILGGGQRGPISFTLIALNVASVGIMLAVSAELCQRAGRPARLGYAVLAAPGLLASLLVAVAEPSVIALTLLAYLLAADGRRRAVLVVAALALLCREAAIVALVPLAWADISMDRRRAAGWCLPVAALLAWWTWVRARVGQWPFLDPSVSRRQALAPPVDGWFRMLQVRLSGDLLFVMAVAVVTLVAAILLARGYPRVPIIQGALLTSLVLLLLGTNAVRFAGECLRLMSLAQVLVITGFVSRPAAGPSWRALRTP